VAKNRNCVPYFPGFVQLNPTAELKARNLVAGVNFNDSTSTVRPQYGVLPDLIRDHHVNNAGKDDVIGIRRADRYSQCASA
jgi:hypothetical protein